MRTCSSVVSSLTSPRVLPCLALLAALLGALTVVVAQPAPPAPPAAHGAAGEGGERTPPGTPGPQMTLHANASTEIRQDTVVITINTNVEAADQSSAGKALTAALDKLVQQAKGTEGVAVHTGGYRVWPNNNDKGKVVNWLGEASVILESKDFPAASALAGKLGDHGAIAGISFTLSRAGREAAERKLLEDAATAFRERALAAATAFGFSGYRIQKIDLGGSGGGAPRPFLAMAKGAAPEAADVPLEPDVVPVTVDVNGTIVLQ